MLTVSGTTVNVTEKMELAIVRQAFEERYANDDADSIPLSMVMVIVIVGWVTGDQQRTLSVEASIGCRCRR